MHMQNTLGSVMANDTDIMKYLTKIPTSNNPTASFMLNNSDIIESMFGKVKSLKKYYSEKDKRQLKRKGQAIVNVAR
jgi:hypothetical protein